MSKNEIAFIIFYGAFLFAAFCVAILYWYNELYKKRQKRVKAMSNEKMRYLHLVLCFSEDLGLKSVTIDSNDTGLPSDSKLLEKAAFVLLRSLYKNADDVVIQDLLNELNIKRERSEQLICPCCGSDKTYKTDAIHCKYCAVTTEI